MKYVFYYDEAFHDRKYVLNPKGTTNVFQEGNLDDYIGFFWGCKNEFLASYIDQLQSFENKYRNVFGLADGQELKSETIKKSNYEFGVHSFKKNTFSFYYDLFSILEKWDFYYQAATISKTELFIRKALREASFLEDHYSKRLIYNLTKLIVLYRPKDLILAMHKVANGEPVEVFWEELEDTLDAIILACEGIPRAKRIRDAYLETRIILSGVDYEPVFETKTDFDYSLPFQGLCNLLKDQAIRLKDIKLTIDSEDNTYIAAAKFPFGKLKQGKSDCLIQIRLSDWLGGFIGRMIRALTTDPHSHVSDLVDIYRIDYNDLAREHLLSDEWFSINERQFTLYKLIYGTLSKHSHNWTTLSTAYSDDMISFMSLLAYFSSYETFDAYKSCLDPHPKLFNDFAVKQMEAFFEAFSG